MAVQRSMRETSNSTMEVFVSCVGSAALLLSFVPQLLRGPFGAALLVGAIVSSVMGIRDNLRRGETTRSAVLTIVRSGVLAFGLVYGCYWFLTTYIGAAPDLFQVWNSLMAGIR